MQLQGKRPRVDLEPARLTCRAPFAKTRPRTFGLTVLQTRKEIELLNELLPGKAPIAVRSDPNTEAEDLQSNAQQAGQALGRPIIIVSAASENDCDGAFVKVAEDKAVYRESLAHWISGGNLLKPTNGANREAGLKPD